MRAIILAAICLACASVYAQSKKELREELTALQKKNDSLSAENQKLKSDMIDPRSFLGASFEVIDRSDLIINEGMYINPNDVNPNDLSFKEAFLKKFEGNPKYRANILRAFGLDDSTQVLTIALDDCRAGDYKEITGEDAVRYISCKAVVIVKNKEAMAKEALAINNETRDRKEKESSASRAPAIFGNKAAQH